MHLKASKQSGVSLIEALVTIVILGFGLLGVALMQAQAMKFNNDSQHRNQATLLAYDLMEKMRMNATGASAYKQTPGSCSDTDLKSAVPATEINCWHRKVAANLPGGSAIVTEPSVNTFQISLSWQERIARETNAQSGITRTQTWTFRP